MDTFFKIALTIIIPLALGIWLFFPKSIPLDMVREGDTTHIKVPDFTELNDKSGIGRMLRTILSAPFDLKHYTVTIKDTAKYEGPKGDLGYHLYLDGLEVDFLKAGSEVKTSILAVKAHNMRLDTKIKISQGDAPSGSKVSFTVSFEVFAKPSWYDFIAKLILILIAWNAIFFLGRDTWEFIQKA